MRKAQHMPRHPQAQPVAVDLAGLQRFGQAEHEFKAVRRWLLLTEQVAAVADFCL
jgi:hypothetical protein